jgi:hypothetical protein
MTIREALIDALRQSLGGPLGAVQRREVIRRLAELER